MDALVFQSASFDMFCFNMSTYQPSNLPTHFPNLSSASFASGILLLMSIQRS